LESEPVLCAIARAITVTSLTATRSVFGGKLDP
jgi:hypothetical protein